MQQQNELIKKDEISQDLLFKGNIAGLSKEQKWIYYKGMCERLGLDAMTQPFKLLNLQGKEVLYCDKSGAEQLTKLNEVSHEIKETKQENDLYIVKARASLSSGRFVDSTGVVSILGLKGDALANAMMKAETKAKRRATLSLLGLGMMDESELDTITEPKIVQNVDDHNQISEENGLGLTFCKGKDCGIAITSQKVLDYSMKQYRKELCYNCQKKEKDMMEK